MCLITEVCVGWGGKRRNLETHQDGVQHECCLGPRLKPLAGREEEEAKADSTQVICKNWNNRYQSHVCSQGKHELDE